MTNLFSLEDFPVLFQEDGAEILDPSVKDLNILYREEEQGTMSGAILYGGNETTLIYGSSGLGKSSTIRKVSHDIVQEHGGKYFEGRHVLHRSGERSIYIYHVPFLNSSQSFSNHINRLRKTIEDYSSDIEPVVFIDQIDMYNEDPNHIFSIIRKTLADPKIFGVCLEKLDGFDRNLEFRPYTEIEIAGILGNKIERSFENNILDENILHNCVVATGRDFKSNVREAMHLLRLSSKRAERERSKKVTLDHYISAFQNKLDSRREMIRTLPKEMKLLLDAMNDLVNRFPGRNDIGFGEIYHTYQEMGGSLNSVEASPYAREIDSQSLHEGIEILREKGVVRKESSFVFESVGEHEIESPVDKLCLKV